jgi:hypothetical protein
MAQELSLGEAARALMAEYGESFEAGFESGKAMMALTLQDRLKLTKSDAEGLVNDLIEAHTIRWEGKPARLAVQETGMFNASTQRVQEGTWYL